MKKAGMLWILILVLALLPLTGLARNDVGQAVADNWKALLDAKESIYAAKFWSLEYIEVFCKEPTWDNLQRARVAAAAVCLDLMNLDRPACTVSNAQLAALAAKGADVSFIPYEFIALIDSLQANADMWHNLMRTLEDEPFWSYGMEYLSKWVPYEKELLHNEIYYTNDTTNYLLLQLEPGLAAAFWDAMPAAYPTLCALREPWNDSSTALEQRVEDRLDQTEGLELRGAQLLSLQTDNVSIIAGCVLSGDWAAVTDQIQPIEGLPVLLPNPNVLDRKHQNNFYFYPGETADSRRLVQVGEDITVLPIGEIMLFTVVPKANFILYTYELEAFSIRQVSIAGSLEDEGPCTLYYLANESFVVLSWEAEQARIYIMDNSACMAPDWFVRYMAE